MAWI